MLNRIFKTKIIYIIIFTFVFHSLSLNWGLVTEDPGYYGLRAFHMDEAPRANLPLQMINNDDLDPHNYEQSSGYVYLIWGLIYVLKIFMPVNILTSIMIGRLVAIIFTLLTLFLIYKIGKETFNENIGLIAAFLLSINPNYYYFATYAKMDSMVVFLVTLSIYVFMKYLKYENINHYYISIFICGLATSTKYIAGLILLAFPLFLILKKDPNFDIRKILNVRSVFIKSLLIFSLGFILLTPYSILNTYEFVRGAGGMLIYYSRGHIGVGAQPYYTHIQTLLGLDNHIVGIGTLTIFILMGSIYLLKDYRNMDKKKEINFLIFWSSLVFIVFSILIRVKMPNQMLMAMPMLMIFAAYGIQRYTNTERYKIFKIGIIIILILLTMTYTISIIVTRQNDTRYYAAQWLTENVKSDQSIAISPYIYVPSPITNITIFPKDVNINWLEKSDFDYIGISGWWYDRYYTYKDTFPEQFTFYDQLIDNNTKYSVVKRIPITEKYYERTMTFGIRSLLVDEYHVEGDIYILRNKKLNNEK